MANKQEQNLMQVLRDRRVQNFKNQFRSVVLEGLEIFGGTIVDQVYKECLDIYDEYLKLPSDEQAS